MPLFVSRKKDVFGSISLVLLTVAVYGNILRIAPTPVSALPVQTVAQTVPTTQTTDPTTETPTVLVPATAASLQGAVSATPTTSASTSKDCTVAAPYSAPAGLSLDSSSPVLTKLIDNTGYYQVYGSSIAQLRSAVMSCKYRVAVAGSYHAITARQINWSYATAHDGDLCTLQDLHIGLHIAQLLPTFTPTATTPASVTAAWNTYAANLATHENGHVAIATRYIEQLTAELQAIGPMRCDLLKSQVATMINSELTILNTEDTLYDAQTNHGATQGAVL